MARIITMQRVPWGRAVVPVVLAAGLCLVANAAWAGRPVTLETVTQLLVFALPVAGIYAVSATGLVVVHSATGIFNFAQGAIGMLCAFVYWELSVRRDLPVWLAMVLVVAVFAPLLGIALDKLLMRRLKRAPLAAQLVGTVGLLIALLGLATLTWNPNNSYPLSPLGGSGGIEIAGVQLTWHRLITITVAILLAVAVQLILRGTRLGISMRAVVDSEDTAALYGVRPARVSATAWVIGCVSAALAGILIAPEVGNMSAETLSLLIVNAFAAAVFGRLRSLSMTYLGALLLGLLVTFSSTFLQFGGRWANLPNALPALALFAVLLLLPQATIRLGGAVRTYPMERLPSRRSVGGGTLALALFVLLAGLLASDSVLGRLVMAMSLAIVLLGLVPLMGWAGIPFLAPLALAGCGGFFTYWAGGSVAALLVAGGATAVVGVLVALPALRLRDLYLALSSVALALVTASVVLTQPEIFEQARTLDRLSLLGVDIGDPARFLGYAAVVYLLLALTLVRLRRSPLGRRFVALRDSEAAAACSGINVARHKALVFAIAGAVSGIGGGVLVQGARFASSDQFGMIGGLAIVLSLTVMGVGTVSGALAAGLMGALLTTLSLEWAPGNFTHTLELVGPALAVLALSDHPRGQIPMFRELIRERPFAFAAATTGLAAGLAAGIGLGLPGSVGVVVAVLLAWAAVVVTAARRDDGGRLPADPPPGGGQGGPADAGTGIDTPFTATGVAMLDRSLGLELERTR
ncbi:ABC transporter permease [Streptomyces albipurpureus]|uniref:ABC transporter permease n=1 Tax=Streptomyces albipurpureus TaxID=2897419 RepID=A0ABT0ULY9_9ACTN|nr:ABC transporter permease [Streptomyces sp. CWNU-1]MCM2389637.1 ABC transporter permease [Streptomyces sp. CWNU-1]